MTAHSGANKAPVTRMGTAALIREMFLRAQDYERLKKKGRLEYRELGMEALSAVLDGEIPVRVHAHRADDCNSHPAGRIRAETDHRTRHEISDRDYLRRKIRQ